MCTFTPMVRFTVSTPEFHTIHMLDYVGAIIKSVVANDRTQKKQTKKNQQHQSFVKNNMLCSASGATTDDPTFRPT